MSREQLIGAGPPRKRDRQPGTELYPATGMLGFDILESKFYGSLSALQATLMHVYTVPEQVTRAVILGLAVSGWPYGFWYNRASWRPVIQGAGAQEYQVGSVISDTANNVLVSGMRWAPMGHLANPQKVEIQMKPGQTLSLAVIHQSSGTRAISIYARAQGVIFIQ